MYPTMYHYSTKANFSLPLLGTEKYDSSAVADHDATSIEATNERTTEESWLERTLIFVLYGLMYTQYAMMFYYHDSNVATISHKTTLLTISAFVLTTELYHSTISNYVKDHKSTIATSTSNRWSRCCMTTDSLMLLPEMSIVITITFGYHSADYAMFGLFLLLVGNLIMATFVIVLNVYAMVFYCDTDNDTATKN